jgi:hypothetical protein
MLLPRSTLIAFLVVAGCSVGEVPIAGGGVDAGGGGGGGGAGGGGGSGTAMGTQAVFDAMIKPLVMRKGCTPCHTGAVQPPNFTSYDTLDAKYRSGPVTTNLLLTEAADGAVHNGVTYFTTAEKTTIKSWIQGM